MKKLAHLFPALADYVSEYQASRNNTTRYSLTPEDNSDYLSPLEFFEKNGRVYDGTRGINIRSNYYV